MKQCRFKTPLTDVELSSVIDESADNAVQAHLAACPACSTRLEAMQRMDNELQRRLSRFECPPAQQLADYNLGTLNVQEQQIVAEHVANCPCCQEDIQMLTEFLALPEESFSAGNIIEFQPSPLVEKDIEMRTIGSLALKGTDDESVYDVISGSASIFMEWLKVSKGFLLTGQILDAEISWVGAAAEIWQGGSLVQITILDDQREFRFEFSAALTFDLRVTALSGKTLLATQISIQA